MTPAARRLNCSLPLISCAILLSGCEVPPLQVTPQGREEIVEAPAKMPSIPAPDPRAAQVPAGYRVDIVAKDLVYPTSVEFDQAGNLYIAEGGYVYGDHAAPARIWRATPDGQMQIIAEHLNGPVTDLLIHNEQLYISHKGKISILTGIGQTPHDLVTELPSLGDHFNNQLAVGPDGMIYFGQGTATNSGVVGVDNFVFGWLGKHPKLHDIPAHDIQVKDKTYITLNPLVLTKEKEPPLVKTGPFQAFATGSDKETIKGEVKSNGTILRMNPDGSGLEVFAWGLRNPFGVMFAPDGKLYAADNGYDVRGSRPIANAPDVIWEVKQNAWYGFPDFAAGIPVTDDRFKPKEGPAPDMLLKDPPTPEKPLVERPHQSAVTKMDISRNDQFGFVGHLFVGEVGDMTPVTGLHHPVGYQVARIDPVSKQAETFFQAAPNALGPTENNMEFVQTAGPKRIVDVKFNPQGDALYVVDIGAIAVIPSPTPTVQPFPGTGVIWRISREGTELRGPNNLSPLKPQPGK